MIKTIAVAAITALVVALAFVGLVNNQTSEGDLGASGSRFPNGISADTTSPTAGQVRGTTLTTTGSATFDIDTFFVDSTNNRVGVGTTTPVTLFEVVSANATTTAYIRNASTTDTTGARIILEDTDGAGCTAISALNGTVLGVTVACP